jgi:hypothetical protein
MKHIWDKDLYRTNPIPIRLRGGKYMSQEEGRKNDTMFWVVLIALLVLVVVGGAYLRWNFWTG